MADFGANATDLSAPSGAGATPVAPVETQAVPSALPGIIQTAGGMLSDATTAIISTMAQQRQKAVLSQYSQTESAINDAVSSGQMSAAEGNTRSRANVNKILAGYPEYATQIAGLHTAFKDATGTGVREQQEKDVNDQQNKLIDAAQSHGYAIPAGSSPAQISTITSAYQAQVRMQNDQEQLMKQHAEQRAEGNYNASVQQREQKDQAVQGITSFAGANLSAFAAQGNAIAAQVKAGKITQEEGQQQLATIHATIGGVLQSMAGVNPEIAAPYRTLFDQLNDTNTKLLDPKADSDKLSRAVQDTINQGKLIALHDPASRATIITSQLFPNSPTLELTGAAQVSGVLAQIQNTPFGSQNTGYVPQVVGNPQVEAGTMSVLKSAIGNLNGGNMKDPAMGKIQLSNSLNQVLAQTGDYLNKGATPDKLKGLATFFASPEYGSMVKQGLVDPSASQAASKTFQMMYQPAVVKAIGDKLTGTITEPSSINTNPQKIADTVDVRVTDSGGVLFVPKKGATNNTEDAATVQGVIKGLSTAQTGLNTLVHIGAHMDGRTDYAKYWDENKYYYLPQLYPVKPGQTVNGYKYNGSGDYKDKNSWVKVNGE